MDIFQYLAEELTDIEVKLKELADNYPNWTIEHVFDRVKYICDAITGHLKKQQNLLLNNLHFHDLTQSVEIDTLMHEGQKERARLEEELGQLCMVHVDEPAYEECLTRLLKAIEEHINFSRKFYQQLNNVAEKKDLDAVNHKLTDMVLHSSEYNAIQV